MWIRPLLSLWAENRDWLHYDPDTGAFSRLSARGRYSPGPMTGCLNKLGYVILTINAQKVLAHRLAWVAVYGEEPAILDYINGEPSDNRIENLRVASSSQNQANSRHKKNNKCGFKGVYAWNGRWRAMIRFDNKGMHIGMYNAAEEAHAAYAVRSKELFGQFARY